MTRKLQIAVIGSAGPDDADAAARVPHDALNTLAEAVGRELGMAGVIVITGGTDGIMEFAAKGAKEAGAITVGIVKGDKRGRVNQWTDVEIVTGMATGGAEFVGPMTADGIIIIGGGAGTLQEIAVAYRNKRPMVALTSPEIAGWGVQLAGTFLDERHTIGISCAATPASAVTMLLELIRPS